jgi:hypothetical protein
LGDSSADEKIILRWIFRKWDVEVKGKGKAIPLQAWTGPGGSMKMRLPNFQTFSTRMW